MNTERAPTPGERELARYREEIRALHADEVDLLRIEETIVATGLRGYQIHRRHR